MDNRVRKNIMFGTVIIDAYRKEEAMDMAKAIDDLYSPKDNYGCLR